MVKSSQKSQKKVASIWIGIENTNDFLTYYLGALRASCAFLSPCYVHTLAGCKASCSTMTVFVYPSVK